MGQPIVQVDAFTDTPFAGNPAAVCILREPRDDAWMRSIAREMNLSETAFLTQQADGYGLRWFTPTVEVELCGHATLASAHVLWEDGYLAADEEARFHTRSGLLTARQQEGWIQMDFPATPPTPTAPPPGLVEALGIIPVSLGKNNVDLLVEVDSENTVRTVQPDMARLAKLPVRGIIVTSRASDPAYDIVSRFFAPGAGIPEDPVTGSAHCCLGPFWSGQLHKTSLLAYQASARGGVVQVRIAGERVHLGGQAVTVMRGEFV
jgi:PhzF family phenazine biosynthesis protein